MIKGNSSLAKDKNGAQKKANRVYPIGLVASVTPDKSIEN